MERRTQRRMQKGIVGLLAIWLLLLLSALGAHADDVGSQLEKQYGLYPDFATNLRVQYIGNRLALAAGLPNETFKVFNDKDLNAMALPDGRVYITSKMATLVTDDELAFVIGHELTHVKEKHAQHQQEKVIGGTILGAILVSVLGGGAEAVRTGADIAGSLTYGHYSQQDEYRADKGGIRLMSQIGYDPKKAADAMQRLLDLYGRGDANTPILGWFADHPDTKNRKQRLLDTAAELQKYPLPKVPAPVGVDITLEPTASHADSWAHAYLSLLISMNGGGRAVALSAPQYPVHALPAQAVVEKKDAMKDDKAKKEEPLKQVVFASPQVPVGYRVTLALRQVPAGRAASIEEGEGTAVEAKLHWTQLSTGFAGDCIATDQTRKKVPWMAQEQMQSEDKLYQLADGKSNNVEGTLEAVAMRRASMAFAEVMEANAPVDHGAPVALNMRTDKLRPGNYVYVVRGNLIVAEVCIDQVTGKKTANGTVLWGVHTWQKKDQFIPEDD